MSTCMTTPGFQSIWISHFLPSSRHEFYFTFVSNRQNLEHLSDRPKKDKVHWFCSYLSNRKQLVSIGNVTSDLKPITCGVPQGSVLGPLLFLLYINDFSKSAPDLDFHLFADDSNLFCSHKSLQCLEAKVNVELNNVNNWLCVNKLSLNIDKSNFVIFHPSQKKAQYPINLIINNKILEEKKYVKYLGIIMDCNLNWKQHIHELSKKVSRSIGILSKLCHYVPQSILIQIYYSIVFPFLIYGVLIWGNTYKSNIYPLVILQKKAIRIITFSHFQSHTSPLFKKFNLLKLPDIVYLYTAVFMHQFHKGNLPEKFNNYFTLVSNQHSYNTRLASKATFILPLVRTNYGLFNIRFCGPKVWNSIEESLKSLSKFSFKKKLKQLILAYWFCCCGFFLFFYYYFFIYFIYFFIYLFIYLFIFLLF